MDRLSSRGLFLGLTLTLGAGCGPEPAVVFVPSDTFEEELFVMTARGEVARIRVGEPLVLHAQRRSGPWKAATEDEVEPEACTLSSPPPQLEAEVAAQVRWIVAPEGSAVFNSDLRADGTREVRFEEAGVYVLTAESSSWCGTPFRGGELRIEVVE
ncbi:MAG: hypothetical protein OEO79_08600 [Gemmatimonadota bacterium]|nr:hypothetical protein [Gemmatimonadota bacterium]